MITPQRTNSPMRGKTKFDIFPIFTPLKAVMREMLSSIGRRSLLQRNPRSQKAKAPRAIESKTNSPLQPLTPSMKFCHSTSRKEAHSRSAAKAREKIYFSIFFTFILRLDQQPSKLWVLGLISGCKVTQKFKMFSNFAWLYNKL